MAKEIVQEPAASTPQAPKTVEERVASLETLVSSISLKFMSAIETIAKEVIASKGAIQVLAGKGTKSQQRLLVPAKYRQPYKTIPLEGDPKDAA